jgi:nucleoside-triphosphatase THEP1
MRWLAHINQKKGPIIGKYRVNKEELDRIGVQVIFEAAEKRDAIAID